MTKYSNRERAIWMHANEFAFIAMTLCYASSYVTKLTAKKLICVHSTCSILVR